MTATPETIARYLEAVDRQDWETLAACFTEDGTASDEGQTHVGRDAIRRWRESVAGRFTYTTTVTGTERVGEDRFDVAIHIEGDFPGGVADLTEAFTLRDGLIRHLAVA